MVLTLSTIAYPNRLHTCQNMKSINEYELLQFTFNEVSWLSAIDRDTCIAGDLTMGTTGPPGAIQL